MKLNNLLLLTLTTLASQNIWSMNRAAIEARLAQEMANSSAATETSSASRPAANADSKIADQNKQQEAIQIRLPEELQRYVASFFITEAWRHKFYDQATSYTIQVAPENVRLESFCAHDDFFLTAEEIQNSESIIGYNTELQLWDIHRAQCIKTLTLPEVALAKTALSARYIVACGHDNVLMIYDRNMEKSHTINIQKLAHGTEASITKIAITSDGKYIILGTGDSRILTFQYQPDDSWRLAYHKRHGTNDYWHGIDDLIFDKENSHLISLSGDNSIKIWDLTTGTLKKNFITPETLHPLLNDQMHGVLRNCVISNDGRTIAAARQSWERPIIWDVESGEHVKLEDQHKWTKSPRGGVYHVSFDAITGHFISHHDGEQRVWDSNGNLLRVIPTNVEKYEFMPGSSCCSLMDGSDQYLIGQNPRHFKHITVRMSVGSADKLLEKLSLEQILFIDDLMRARDKGVQKDLTKPLVLDKAQQDLFKTLPAFVQTALSINLNLQQHNPACAAPFDSAQDERSSGHTAGDEKAQS